MQGATLTNGPGCCPDARQEQQRPCSESCYLGSRTTWHSPATCNRDHAGATARPSSSGWGLGTGSALSAPTCLSLPGPAGRAASPRQRGQPGVQLPKGFSWEGEGLGQLPPSLPALLAFLLPSDAALQLRHHVGTSVPGPLTSANFPRRSRSLLGGCDS